MLEATYSCALPGLHPLPNHLQRRTMTLKKVSVREPDIYWGFISLCYCPLPGNPDRLVILVTGNH
jgi:hypothetical protein